MLFQSLPRESELVEVIEGVSGSHFSHCGVVRKRNGEWVVEEALGVVRTVPLEAWILRGRGARYDVYRFDQDLEPHLPRFLRALEGYRGRPYDYRYDLDDFPIYCSELIHLAWEDATGEPLGELVPLGDLDWEPTARRSKPSRAVPLHSIDGW